ncbi:DUF4832 domain-containing protein [Cohnella herbarum]|uniref:DUF4832 domain-containing protein n=1 Tax=Cohnella herbarum TaxID=2728023 RepID=A0A7Z2VJ99_9BACL|nr:DUF4832 domain-containing protein [Cohnella herbarum]QJD83895.1 DUF4832 domain-containing protein [Cohnella herbarum]
MMLKKKLLAALLTVILIAGLLPAYVANAASFTFNPDYASVFPNPERGYHNRYEIVNDPSVNDYASSATSIAGFNPDMLDRTFARAKQAGNSLIHSYIHLDKYTNADQLPQALLDSLSSGLAAIRTAGLKIVLRPAYAWSGSPTVPESRILGHIQQINAVISANADVVLHLEAGYLGPWGEWHTSQFTDPFTRTDADTRYRIIKKILSTTPSSIPLVIRYPIFIKEVLELPTPSGTTALTQDDKDRIGFHNDCFLSDSADMGTYDNNSWMGWFYVEQKKQWMYDLATSTGGNKMMGGETCDSAGSNDLAGVNVQSEMSKLNFTEINEDFAAVNINIWKNANLSASGNDPAETAFTRIKRKLGYRLRLIDANFPTSISPGGSFGFSANLSNDGYSGIIKSRPAFLVFDNGTQRYNVQLTGVDVRQWLSGPVALSNQTVALPGNMVAGTYKLALWLPDADVNLRTRPEYSVRFANTGTWDAVKGYNVLANAISVSGDPVVPEAPANLQASPGNSQVTLTWDISAGASSYTVLRSATSGSGYAQIASGLTSTSYTNTGLTNGTTYYYVVRAVNAVGTSGNSNQAGATPAAISIPSAPASLTATPGNSQVVLTWPASTGATSYTVLRSATNGTGYAQVATGIAGTSYTNTALTNGTTYYYVVRAANGAGSSGNSPQASATPSAPQPVTIDSYANQTVFANKKNDLNQSFSWTMDSLYYGSDSSGNIVLNSGGNGQFLQENVNQSLAGASNLIIRARDWSDTDTESHWNVVLNDGTDHTVGPISTYGNITGSYTDIAIPLSAFNANLANTQYLRIVHRDATYSVLMIDTISADGGGTGGNGGDTIAPSVPANLASTGKTSSTVGLSWSASTDNVGVTGYVVYRNGTQVGTLTGTSFTDTGLSAATTYSYTVKATDAAGNQSAASPSLLVTTDAASSQISYEAEAAGNTLAGGAAVSSCGTCSGGSKVGYVGNNGGTLQFNGVTPASSGSQTVKVYYLNGDAGRSAQISVNGGSPATLNFPNSGGWSTVASIDVTLSLTAGTNTIKLSNSGGWAPDFDRITLSAPPDAIAPSIPSNLASTVKTSNSVSLSWSASTDNVGVTGYVVYRNGTSVGTPTGTAFTDTGLAANTSYNYTVKAADAAGNLSAASSSLAVTTNAPPPGGAASTVPAGVPVNPYAVNSPDASLAVHPLAKGTDPVTNPLKGFAIWYYPGDHADKTATQYGGINNSIEWKYFGFGELMTGANSYDWELVEKALDEVASHGKQLSLRVASCESFSSKDVPDFLMSQVRNGCILNYDSPVVMQAFQNFIAAFGAKYDGDPRIAFIHMGLVGRWGEWHTWPNDGSNGTQNWMMSDANANLILDAYNSAFRVTRVENRYPRSGGGTHITTLARIGYHDDSFAYREMDPVLGRVGSMTLPLSMNGKSDSLLTQALLFGAENKWVTASIGGEVRPEVQGNLFDPASATKDDALTDVEMTHATWMICQNCKYNKNDPNEVSVWQKMGYNFYAKNAYFNNSVSGSFKVGVQIENSGSAPFYYGPDMYPVELALKDGSGNIVKTWTTDWDLRTIVPKQVKVFPEWNVSGNPIYVNFGQPQYFDATVNAAGVPPGQYKLVMHVYNPLWKIKEADVRAKGHMPSYLPWNNPLPILFANQSQGADGWLELGPITLQ